MYNAFISYSSLDGDFAERIAQDLENRGGLEVWLRKWEIMVGDSLVDKIFNDGLCKNDFFIVILSPNSISSDWVKKEINVSLVKELNDKNVTILPILYQECCIPRSLSDKKVANFVTDYRQGMRDLLLAICPEVYKEKLKRQTGNIIGIDFGTSNSLAAIIENGHPMVIPNREGNKLTPSVAAFTNDGQWIAGVAAKLQAETNVENTFFSIKSTFGTGFTTLINGIPYKNYEIASEIFKKIKDDCEFYLWKEVKRVVLTCPVNFKQCQKYDLVKSAELVGLEVIRLISEPNAVVFAYGLHKNYDKHVAVYDLGGGSFDVSICDCGEDVLEVKSVNGDTRLGGDDIDKCILNYCIDIFEEKTKISIRDNPVAVRRALKEVENAKVILTSASSARVYVPFIVFSASKNPMHLDVTITIDVFENLVSDLIDRSIHCCKKALADWHAEPCEVVSKVILSGLSTKVPLVRKKVKEFFGMIPECKVDPDEVVALGASIQAGVIERIDKNSLMLDIVTFSFGIELMNGDFLPIIKKHSTLPTSRDIICNVKECTGKNVIMHIFEGNSKLCTDNNYFGTMSFKPVFSRYSNVDIIVTMDIGLNGEIYLEVSEFISLKDDPEKAFYMKNFTRMILRERTSEKSYIEKSNIEISNKHVDSYTRSEMTRRRGSSGYNCIVL